MVKAPWYLRMFGIQKKRFKIHPLYLGTLVFIGKFIPKIDINKVKFESHPMTEVLEKMPLNGVIMAKIVAVSVLNSRIKILLFYRMYQRYFLWHITPADLKILTVLVLQQTNVQDFIYSIVSLKGLDVVSPKGTSPHGTGETIAPGELLEQ